MTGDDVIRCHTCNASWPAAADVPCPLRDARGTRPIGCHQLQSATHRARGHLRLVAPLPEEPTTPRSA